MTFPAPLVPAEVDLRGLDYMPLFGNHLFGSEFNAAATDSEWRAALTLWWAAWNQVPAGSLPSDDGALCRLADLGRDVKTWKKLRARALHGFTLCSDGRLYHAFICEQAMVAWDKRIKERERKAKWRAEQDAKKAGRGATVPGTSDGTTAGTGQGRDATVRADGNGMDGNGRDDKESVERAELARAQAEADGIAPTRAGSLCRAMREQAGFAVTNPGDLRFAALVEQGITEAECVGLAAECVAKGKGWAWFLDVLPKRRADAAAIALAKLPDPQTGAKAADETQRYLAAQQLTPEQRKASEEARRRVMGARQGATT